MPSVVRQYLRWFELAKHRRSIDPRCQPCSPPWQACSTMAEFPPGFDLDGCCGPILLQNPERCLMGRMGRTDSGLCTRLKRRFTASGPPENFGMIPAFRKARVANPRVWADIETKPFRFRGGGSTYANGFPNDIPVQALEISGAPLPFAAAGQTTRQIDRTVGLTPPRNGR